jgi:hypothetical protein
MKGFYDAMEKRFDLRIHFVDDYWPSSIKDISDYEKYDACIWYVRFRELIEKPAFDWTDFKGLRVMYDEDAHINFHLMADQSHYLGKWPIVFKRQEFQMMICTGKQTRDALISDGVKAHWLPKAYDPSRLFDKKIERSGVGYFGALYGSRKAMLHYLQRKKIKFNYFHCSDQELNDELNKYTGCLICNMGGKVKPGVLGLINKIYPSIGIELYPGFEPMLKNFEVAGAGCAPIADWIDELKDLGFEDGKTIISYNSFQELADKLWHYQQKPDVMKEIGFQANLLARERHTWDHRAEELEEILFPTVK